MAEPSIHPSPPRVRKPERSFWTPLRVALVLLLLPALGYVAYAMFPGHADLDAAATRQRLHDLALRRVAEADWFRADGQAYAVDLAQLAIYAALAGDRELYDPLRAVLLEKIVVPPQGIDGDLEARDMAAWGFRRGLPLDASGTTETLRVAEALWLGGRAFADHRGDRDLVKRLAEAYVRHEGSDRGVWMIRNYYNFDTRAYSTNSFLIDYDPDFVATLAEAFEDEKLAEVAARSAALMDLASTPAGLLHQMIRPEVATIQPMPDSPGIYSVNGIEQMSNVLASAERCVETNPRVARRVLAFCRDRLDTLRRCYRYDTGEPAHRSINSAAGLETWAVVLRLAVKLDDRAMHDAALERVLRGAAAQDFTDASTGFYMLGETLLSLEASGRYMAER